MNQFISIQTPEEVHLLAEIANTVWHEYFPCILTTEQIDYMVEKFQSETALTKQIAEGYRYYICMHAGKPAGYFGVSLKENGSLFLSKLYLNQEFRGKGIASVMFAEIKQIAKACHATRIWLTVNKNNTKAIAVYRHFGMQIIRAEVTDIGKGFVMDDYVFELLLN